MSTPINPSDEILRQLVRRYAYELLTRAASPLLNDFPAAFAAWQPNDPAIRRPADEHHHRDLHRLCDAVYQYLRPLSKDVPLSAVDLENLLTQWLQPKSGFHGWVGESLEWPRYEFWGLSALETDPLANFETNGMVGDDPVWRRALQLAARAAQCDFPVLITGETGTGKELLARAIHNNSSRANHPCVAINCAALPDTLVETELFGYRAGAFTGGVPSGRRGRMETASGGTVILDEVAELSPHAQAALLRALQNGELQKLGGDIVRADFRVIAISNRPLENEVDSGKFRRDLFYRIAVVPIALPPLRQRTGDVPLLARHFLDRFRRANTRLTAAELSSAAIKSLAIHPWRGNVRELENVIARAMVLCHSAVIEPQHIIFTTGNGVPASDDGCLARLTTAISNVNSLTVNPRELAIFLSDHPNGVASGDYARRFGCGASTARRHLEVLRGAGILEKRGAKKGTAYSLVK